jgi:hypothetical protein
MSTIIKELEQIEEHAYKEFSKNIKQVLKEIKPNSTHKALALIIPGPAAMRLHRGINCSCILPCKTRHRGRIILVGDPSGNNEVAGKAFMKATLYTVKKREEGYEYIFRNTHQQHKRLLPVDLTPGKRICQIIIPNSWG